MIIGIVLVALMVLSTLGYAFFYNDEAEDESLKNYNGLLFKEQSGYWLTQIQGYDFSFIYYPEDIESFPISMNLTINDYIQKPLYFVSSKDSSEVARNLQGFVLRMQNACYENCNLDLPVKNCTDNLIIFEDGENEIKQEGNCIFISGNNSAMLEDAFIYRILGVR